MYIKRKMQSSDILFTRQDSRVSVYLETKLYDVQSIFST